MLHEAYKCYNHFIVASPILEAQKTFAVNVQILDFLPCDALPKLS